MLDSIRRIAATGVAAVALTLALFAGTAVVAHAEGPGTAVSSHPHDHVRWHRATVNVFSNWDAAICTGAYSNPTGDSNPPLSAREMRGILSTVIAQLNRGLDGGLVLVDAGTGPAGAHCGQAPATAGVISVGWSPLTQGIAGIAPQALDGDVIIGAGVIINSLVPCSNMRKTVEFTLLHEMMHTLGIPHSDVPRSLMYERSDCDATARLGADAIAEVHERYPAPIRPDAASTRDLTQRPGATRFGVVEPALTPSRLVAQLAAADCDARLLAVTVGGRFLMYVPGAPAFVNAAFPSSLSAGSPYLYRCAG